MTHQEFIDDILLFYQASVGDIRAILQILEVFMEASGTLVNNDKSNVYFFNVTNETKVYLARLFGFNIGSFPLKYLGVTLSISPLRIFDWRELLTKMEKKLQNSLFMF